MNGRQPSGTGQGPGGKCKCPECGFIMEHETGQVCNQQECPKCGVTLIRDTGAIFQ